MKNHIDPTWICSIDGKLTFCGAYEEYYPEISQRWRAKSTREQYNRIYNNLILPNLPGHNDRSIDTYTLEDYNTAVQAIIDCGQPNKSGQYMPYADSTIRKFRYLIDVVVYAAAKHHDCDYVFWGSCFAILEEMTREQVIKERIKLKKSLTIPEEYAVASHLLSNAAQRGQEMGLLLMFALGLRNNEAAAADYGDIRSLSSAPDVKTLLVYKSTIVGTNLVKASGKTKNSDRIIPIPGVLDAFIAKRRAYLEKTISFPLGEKITCVDDLPIACLNHDYATRCSSDQLTAAGREMFRRIKMESDKLAFIDLELSSKSVSAELKEKDPSAYLLRRNWGTHLKVLGLSEAEIEYLMGHDIMAAYETRNEFVNDTRLLAIKKKLDQRPILNTQIAEQSFELAIPPNETQEWSGHGTQTHHAELSSSLMRLCITASEPGDPLRVSAYRNDETVPSRIQLIPHLDSANNDRTIDVINKYHELYRTTKQ